MSNVSDMVGSKNVKIKDASLQDIERLPKTIFEEFDGSTRYSITKGIFYIPDLHSKHLAYKVMKHIKYDKPIIEYCWDKIKAEIMLKELKAQ